MSSLLSPPPTGHDDGQPPQEPPRDDRPVAHRRGPRGSLVAALIVLALTGGVAGAGLLAATGALDHGASTTTVVQPSGSGAAASGSSSTSLNARALYERTAAGVVDITAKVSTTSSAPGPFGQPQSQQATASGTGFVIDGTGRIVTAAHVVDQATKITVTFQDGTKRTAKVLGVDDATDVAVIDVDSSGLTLHPLRLGSSSALHVGDPVAAIGDPFEYDRSLSTGIVSGLDRSIEAPNGFTVAHAIQTDAALNPGNSGGPILTAGGAVVGVVDQIATNGNAEQSSGVGFAVPSDIVSAELADLIAGRKVSHAYIGVSSTDATTTTAGATVAAVTAGGPAADAGIRAGDVITTIGGQPVQGSADLVAAVADHRPGDEVQVRLRRDGDTKTVTVRLGTQPASSSSGSSGG